MTKINFVECPRDAMQGWAKTIDTNQKVKYLNNLLKVGFHTLDCGSFVSPKAIPQMADTKLVIPKLQLNGSTTKLLTIVANIRGAYDAVEFSEISFLGFPFSISETFQQKNTNSSIEQSLKTVENIQTISINRNKKLVVYLSMAFGNPYSDKYNEDIVYKWADSIAKLGVETISLADTVGVADAPLVKKITEYLIKALPNIEVGVHLHSEAYNWKDKADAALNAGCRRFDGAVKGIGGCPLSGNALVGNMNTELMINHFTNLNLMPTINQQELTNSINIAEEIFV